MSLYQCVLIADIENLRIQITKQVKRVPNSTFMVHEPNFFVKLTTSFSSVRQTLGIG